MVENGPNRWKLNEKDGDAVNLQNFKIFKQQWNNYCIIKGLGEKSFEIQKAYLESCLDAEGLSIYNRFMENFTTREKESVTNILNAFESRLAPKTTARYSCYMFQNIQQGQNESIDTYVNRLWKMAKLCKFENLENMMVCNQFIFGLHNEKLRDELLKNEDENITLTKTISIAKVHEMHEVQLAKIKPASVVSEEDINRIDNKRKLKDIKICKFCNKKHLFKKELCPAWGKTCKNCNKENHFASCCPKTDYGAKKNNKFKETTSKPIKKIDDDHSDSSEDIIKTIEQVGLIPNSGKILRGNIYMKDEKNRFKAVTTCWDTGASCCVIGKENLRKINKQPYLRKSTIKLKAFNGDMTNAIAETIIECKTDIHVKTRKVLFQVVEGNLEPLLSSNACQVLKLIKVNKDMVINNVQKLSNIEELNKIIHEYEDVFEGDGRISTEVRFEVDETVLPVQEKPRRIPITVRRALKEELDRLEEKGIIEKVTHATDWVSNIVLVKKKDKNKIRICLDPQFPNIAIKRPTMPTVTIEEILPELEEAKIFSVLDAKNGYWQVPLKEYSRDITTFWTPFNRYRFKVLPFGINASGDIYQQKQLEILQGLKGIECVADDILIIGKGTNEDMAFKDHNKNLENLMEKCRKSNMKLNKEKMKLAVKEVKFYGHKLTTKGVTADEDKTNAILKMGHPENIKDVQKFLGMVTYLSMYLPNLSKVSEPLREIVRTKSFQWGEYQNDCFENIKTMICRTPILRYYNVNEEVVIQTDGSRKGLGAVMLQGGQPVMYISKALTNTEKNYSQCDIELLAIVFACMRLNQFICGKNNIIVETDHIALKQIFNKPIYKCTTRVQRLRLKLQKYDLKIRYCPGKKIVIADMLSRFPLKNNEQALDEDEIVMQHYMNKIEKINMSENEEIDDKQIEEIKAKTKEDPCLQKIVKHIQTNWRDERHDDSLEINKYKACKEQLSTQDGILFKDERFVIPKSLQQKYLELIHYGHSGIQACLEKARRTVFWPGITTDIKYMIKRCITCLRYADMQQKLPMLSHNIPAYPYQTISMDFCEIEYQGRMRNILVSVDHFSDYIEINMMKSTIAEEIILVCKTLFARYGIPKTLITDGAHNFLNKKFLEFSENWNFNYTNSSPYYPQGNGKAESAVKIIKKLIKKCEDSNQCIYKALLEQRNTPNETSYSPAERFMNRNTRSSIPRNDNQLLPKISADVSEKIEERRWRSKQQYDIHSKQLNDLTIGANVVTKLRPTDKKNSFAKINKKLSERSYEIVVDGKRYIRNRQHLREVPKDVKIPYEGQNPTARSIINDESEASRQNIYQNPHKIIETPSIRDENGITIATPHNFHIDVPIGSYNSNWLNENKIDNNNGEVYNNNNNTGKNIPQNVSQDDSEAHEHVENNDHNEESNQPTNGRPKRTTRQPAHLKDYYMQE